MGNSDYGTTYTYATTRFFPSALVCECECESECECEYECERIQWKPIPGQQGGKLNLRDSDLRKDASPLVEGQPSTLHPEPCTLKPAPCTLHPEP